jgi:hypothetical protein
MKQFSLAVDKVGPVFECHFSLSKTGPKNRPENDHSNTGRCGFRIMTSWA